MSIVKEKWWIVNIDNKIQLCNYRNPQKLERYLKKMLKTSNVNVLREATLEDYNKYFGVT
jgi:hypothetical protein